MSSLATSILLQRVNKVTGIVNARVVSGLGSLVLMSTMSESRGIFESINKVCYDAVWHDDQILIDTVLDLRVKLSKFITKDMGFFMIYLTDLLDSISAIGNEKEKNEEKRQADAVVRIPISYMYRI